MDDIEIPITRSLLEAAVREIREWKVEKGGDDQVLLNLEAAIARIGITEAARRAYIYRDTNNLQKCLDAIADHERLVSVIAGKYGPYHGLDEEKEAGYRLIIETTECQHTWEEGFSMNGPTRTCKKCGKFERD